MVYFVLTRAGFDELSSQHNMLPSPLWVNDGVLSPSEISDLRDAGSDITNFVKSIDPHDMPAITDAISTVQEHCPGKRIWVEYAP